MKIKFRLKLKQGNTIKITINVFITTRDVFRYRSDLTMVVLVQCEEWHA